MQTQTTTAIEIAVCNHCGNIHTGRCPHVKAIEYYENGAVKRIEYSDFLPSLDESNWQKLPEIIY